MRFLNLLITLVTVGSVHAAPVVETGDRVRATLIARPNPHVTGTLLSYGPESITLAVGPDSAESTLARPSIKRLEISEGMHSSAGHGAKYGAIVGFFTLFGLGAAAGGDGYDSPGAWYVYGPIYGALGAVAGAGVGALVGSASQHERWERVRVPR